MLMRRLILLGLPLVPIGAVLVFAWVRPGEPRYQGRTLSSWLAEGDPGHVGLSAEAKTALSEMGSNAVPYLVRMLDTADSPFKKRVTKLFEDRGWGEPPFHLAYRRQYTAAFAFEAIGREGVGAIPRLQSLLNDEDRGCPAAYALGRIGAEAISALTNGFTSTNREVRRAIAFQIGRFGANAAPAIPALVQALSDADDRVAGQAAASLGKIRDRPGQILPVLMNCLMDSRPRVRRHALLGIGDFENDAGRALPQVLELMGDPVELVRNEAIRTVCRIEKAPIPLLISQLQNSEARVRQAAAYGLEFHARRDTNAFNALTNLLADEQEAVRKQAAKALKSIDRARAFRMKVP